MKDLIGKNVLIFIIFLVSCRKEPKFFINGVPYYTNSRCVKDTSYTEWTYHYGYNFFRGKYETHFGPTTTNKCLEYRIDTIEIKDYDGHKR